MTQPVPPPSDPRAVFDQLSPGRARPLDDYLAEPPAAPRPPSASDPTVLTDGRVVPRAVPEPAGSGQFTVDLAHAPQAIRELEDALVQMKQLKDEAALLSRVSPPASDAVSRDAATVLGAVAVGGAGSLMAALDAGVVRLQQIITGLRNDLSAYEESDGTGSRTINRSYLA